MMRQHLEVYLTTATAAAVGLLGLLGVVEDGVVSAATLAVLALVAFHLTARRPATSTTAPPYPPSDSGSTPPSIHQAHDIRIIGVTLNRTIRALMQDLEYRLAQGARVQVAIIDPAGTTPAEAARRCTLPDGAKVFQHRLWLTLDQLRHLQTRHGRIEVRLLPFVPAYGLLLVDPTQANGTITIDVYSHRPSGRELVLTLRPDRGPYWYEHFHSEFERIWAAGRPVQVADEHDILVEMS